MTNLMTETFVQEALNSSEQFPIDFNDVWQGLGYSRKDSAVRSLKSKLIENVDFSSSHINVEREIGSSKKEIFSLSVDGYKHFSMMAETEQGRKARCYFIDVEKQYRENLNRLLAQPAPIVKPKKQDKQKKFLEQRVIQLEEENNKIK